MKEELPKITPAIQIAVEIMRESFGGTEVEIVSDMYRLDPTEDAKGGRLGADIKINGIKTFLGHESMAEDICIYGKHLAEEFVYKIIKSNK